MKQVNLFLFAVCALPLFSKAQLIINSASIVLTPGTILVLDNISLQNNGVFDQSAGTVAFTGGSNSHIDGANACFFYDFLLDKPAALLQLQSTIRLRNQLKFNNGLLEMGISRLLMEPGALLVGENEISHIYGNAGGFVEINQLLNAPSAANPGNLGIVITSSQNMGSVRIRRGHLAHTNVLEGGSSIFRYYDITPANNSSLNATLRFNYLDGELNGLNENTLTVWKSVGLDWANLGRSSNNIAANYVEQTGIDNFSRFTLGRSNSALPLTWNSFNTQCLSGQVRISWKTEQEQNTLSFIIQRSTDGRSWTTIGTLPAAGNSNTAINYSYTDQQSLPGTSYYQIQQKDIDGRFTISPVLSNTCGMPDELKVYPNPVLNNCRVNIQLARGGKLIMKLYDSKGSLIQLRQEFVQNGNSQFELRLSNVAKGLYSLVITLPDGTNMVKKIEKY
jgi:hypothetical protein